MDTELLHQLAIPSKGSAGKATAGRAARGKPGGGREAIGLGQLLDPSGPLSAALMTTVGGRDTQFSDVSLIADWDGREDCTPDRAATVDDLSAREPEIDASLTRVAISEHTRANGFTENIYYYGDSVGNVWVGSDSTGDALVDDVTQLHLPTLLNAFGTLLSDDQIVITGLAVNPVADLSSFSNVNAAFSPFDNEIGEILYVTYLDTGGGLRLSSNNTIVRGGLLAFPISDDVSPATSPPGVQSPLGFPVTVGGAFGVVFTTFSPFGGLAVDDDGSVYFAQADLIQRTGGNIVKVTSEDSSLNQDRSLAVSNFFTITSLNPTLGQYGTSSGIAGQVNRFTNFSGTSTLFGNVVALSAGPCNTLYAALAKSKTPGGGVTEGLFPAPAAWGAAGTPSMIISFADCHGDFDKCSGLPQFGIGGQLPIGNGIADEVVEGALLVPGVNNFLVYALGNGPDIRSAASAVVGSASDTLKLDMQIDFTIHAGLVLDEGDKLFVISGGTPGAIGLNPSPERTEILWFSDHCPADRRADFVDYRGDMFPNPPESGGNIGDGDSDRFDHIYLQAPVDGVTFTPTGLSGLARGFLLYLNRERNDWAAFPNLPNGSTQGDDDTSGPIAFEEFDPTGDAAGGDDEQSPFYGDDSAYGGFEFTFGAAGGECAWNEFFLNSNGNITFGSGDTDNTASLLEFRAGLPRIAPAWNDLNPGARSTNLNTFPVQALGFTGVNAFKVRWINVPEFGNESCDSRNTVAIVLHDDGTGRDENDYPQTVEGPTDLVFEDVPEAGVLVGCPPRRDGTGHFCFEYCRMDVLGTESNPVLTGYSVGSLAVTNPPGLCEINASEAARAADGEPFGVIQGQTASIQACLIGEGTEPELYEVFDQGFGTSLHPTGKVLWAYPDFDLREEGNDPLGCKPELQRDPNRDRVCFFGTSCELPPNPVCATVVVGPFDVAPNQEHDLINALCDVQLDIVGCGFYPNEVTTICPTTGNVRPGKVVSTAVTLSCEACRHEGYSSGTVALSNVTPISENLIRATLPVLPGLPGTAFPLSCCGGVGILTVTTTFTPGDNNQFGPFSRTTSCAIDLGVRAPVVLSVTPSDGNCNVNQDVLISGSCFLSEQGPVSRVFAVGFNPATQALNPANTIDALAFTVLSDNLIDAYFDFDGGTYMVFVTGPGGTSRNLTQAQTQPGCVRGNEQGIQVTFTCQQQQPQNQAPVANCKNVAKAAAANGFATVSASEINNGSFDPDGDSISLSLNPTGPYPVGNTLVTLRVTDSHGVHSSCQATVTVTASGGVKPKVRIQSPDPAASEPGINKGRLRIIRSGSTAAPLTVYYAVSGTATPGSDYTALPGSATIPVGKNFVDIIVAPKNDFLAEPVETVIVILSANAAYTIVAPVQGTVRIQDND